MNLPFGKLALALLLGLAPLARGADLLVFAAASLSDACQEIGAKYEAAGHGTVHFNFAGSNTLARQIAEGAPADVFLSADEIQMDGLKKSGQILPESERILLSNTLAVVVSTDAPERIASFADLGNPAIGRIAIADPRGVPAGIYAKLYLEKLNLWEAIEPRIIPTENVRAALAAVEAGNADAGIVYQTDAQISRTVRIACVAPTEDAPPIRYPVAIVTSSQSQDDARRFLDFLQAPEARRIFQRFGFLIVE